MTTQSYLKESEHFDEISKVQEAEQKTKFVTIDALEHPKLKLRYPLSITIEKDRQNVIANYSEIESFGCGQTETEAISDLLSEITEIYHELEQGEAQLSSLSKKWWTHLQTVVTKK